MVNIEVGVGPLAGAAEAVRGLGDGASPPTPQAPAGLGVAEAREPGLLGSLFGGDGGLG